VINVRIAFDVFTDREEARLLKLPPLEAAIIARVIREGTTDPLMPRHLRTALIELCDLLSPPQQTNFASLVEARATEENHA